MHYDGCKGCGKCMIQLVHTLKKYLNQQYRYSRLTNQWQTWDNNQPCAEAIALRNFIDRYENPNANIDISKPNTETEK